MEIRKIQDFLEGTDALSRRCAITALSAIRVLTSWGTPNNVGLPDSLSFAAFDGVNALGYSLTIWNMRGSRSLKIGRKCALSLWFTESRKRIRERSKDIPDDKFELMVSFGPYRGGNKLLWAWNNYCNSHKHETLPLPFRSCRWHSDDKSGHYEWLRAIALLPNYHPSYSKCEEVTCRPAPDV